MFPLMKGNANFHTSLNSICNVTEICGGKPYTIFCCRKQIHWELYIPQRTVFNKKWNGFKSFITKQIPCKHCFQEISYVSYPRLFLTMHCMIPLKPQFFIPGLTFTRILVILDKWRVKV